MSSTTLTIRIHILVVGDDSFKTGENQMKISGLDTDPGLRELQFEAQIEEFRPDKHVEKGAVHFS